MIFLKRICGKSHPKSSRAEDSLEQYHFTCLYNARRGIYGGKSWCGAVRL